MQDNFSFSPALYRKNKEILRANLESDATCPYCNCIMTKNTIQTPSTVTIDHIHPQSKGGSNELENLIAVCMNCNVRKSSLNKATFFYLNEPQTLSTKEYEALNDYMKFSHRITVLKEVISLVRQGNVLEVVDLIQATKQINTNVGFFKNVLKTIRKTMNKTINFAKQLKETLKSLNSRLHNELRHLKGFKGKVQHINFTTYSIINFEHTKIHFEQLAA